MCDSLEVTSYTNCIVRSFLLNLHRKSTVIVIWEWSSNLVFKSSLDMLIFCLNQGNIWYGRKGLVIIKWSKSSCTILETFEIFHKVLIICKLNHKHFCIWLLQWKGKCNLLMDRYLWCYWEMNEEDGNGLHCHGLHWPKVLLT